MEKNSEDNLKILEEEENSSEEEGENLKEEEIEPEIPYGNVCLNLGKNYYNYDDYEIEWE